MTDIVDDNVFAFQFDDDLFTASKEKQQITITDVDYQAKIETDGWFHTDRSIDELMLETHGPNQLKSSIEHNYLYKKYDRALDQCLEFIRVADTNDQCKVNGTKEVTEIAMHCAAKLKKLDLLKKLLNEKQFTMDTGLMLARGKFLSLVGQYKEAMHIFVVYHKERKLDYKVWVQMADIFMETAEIDENVNVEEMRYHLANLSVIRALHIYTNSRWKNNVGFVKERFEKELKVLESKLVSTKGNADKFVEWMADENKNVQTAGLSEFDWEDIVWIYKDWILRQDLEIEDEGAIKAAKEL
ncbi:hypothetical protein G6F56_004208 [Rhizopus delemar]|uniref:Uncharacterized protein n=1 Tax=Rhizopus stolonifer TaxID=4846 RepID=A0A367KS33_RHIST|nr:hypothetical protein G6F56_004208 [Rhizopus delemar]RCI05018.1 hypothetical protein CU098_010488 [Rhizopus stolonifer]